MKKVFIDEDQVVALADLAKSLARSHGWKDHRVDGANGRIEFTSSEGVKCVVDTSGFAQRVVESEGGNVDFEDWDGENVDWDEEFDGWNDHVWAEDEDGNTVMLHN